MRSKITITVRVSWWVPHYINGVALCAWLMGSQPDMDRVAAKVLKGIRLQMDPLPQQTPPPE